MDWSSFLLDALPHAVGTPVCMATLRASPEDFQVDEIPSFDAERRGRAPVPACAQAQPEYGLGGRITDCP